MDYENDFEAIIPHFEPWVKYPSLTVERLSVVATIIRKVHHEAILLHEPQRGDTNWGLGCRVYERTCYEIRSDAPRHAEWLSILPEAQSLQFSFAIGSIPFRFYRGKPDELPDRYRITSFGELHHLQMCLSLDGLRPPDNVLRLAVEISPSTLEVTTISVVEVDTAGNAIGVFEIPAEKIQAPKVTVMQAKPVELAPPLVEPLTTIEEIAESNAEENKVSKTDTGA